MRAWTELDRLRSVEALVCAYPGANAKLVGRARRLPPPAAARARMPCHDVRLCCSPSDGEPVPALRADGAAAQRACACCIASGHTHRSACDLSHAPP